LRAFDWFLGENDLKTVLIDADTGSCSDGLHPDRPNENKGAESALLYRLGLVEIRELKRTAMIDRTRPATKFARGAENCSISPRTTPGGHLVSIPILEPPGLASAPGPGQGRRPSLQAGD